MTTEIVKADEAAPTPGKRGLTPKTARRLATAERVLYGAAGTWAALGPQLDLPWWAHAPVIAVGGLSGRRLWKRTADDNGPGLLLSTLRALPVLGWSGAYTSGLLAPVAGYAEGWPLLASAAWTLVMVPMMPWTRSRGLARAIEQLPQQTAEPATVVAAPTTFEDHVRQMWQRSPATGETTLEAIRQHTPGQADFTALILAPAGQAVPSTVTPASVGAAFDVPPPAVMLLDADGYGPGRLILHVTPTQPQQATRKEGLPGLWEERVSNPGGAAPGMHLVDYRISEDRVRILIEAGKDQLISLPRLKLARVLDMDDPELLMVETDGLARGVVTVYREHPLINIREATAEDLTMGPDGRITIGLRHDGRPFRMPLYDPEMGALTDLAVGAMGSGKSVFLLTVLIAERLSGVISLVADAQSGMSLPEANGRVRHFGAGLAAMGATLAGACAVADYREKISAANGWGSFVLGDPWRLANVTLDEINLAIGEHAICPKEFSKWLVMMIARLQQTGRKFGFGIRFAGQSIHVADLGDAEKIRANAKQGTVWMGRVNSTMTQSMATDMVNDGTEITPIRRFFGSVSEELEAAWDGKDVPPGPITAGMAWGLQGGRATLMRVFKALKKDKTYPHLITLFERAPSIPGFSPEEDAVFRHAYAEALLAGERFLAGEDPDGDSDDEDGEGGKRRRKSKNPGLATPPPSVPTAPKSIKDQILEALADEQPHRTREIRAAVGVGTPDGPAAGTVDNWLSKLAAAGDVIQPRHGYWALTPRP
ncbi:hypothetical protein [Streptomyces sp. NPDC053048]|uniref:hypothetical protein n=1 Tax=Streptomyces sp. NPDC053048 TaxID=3365694 RepID=UPI0037D417D2